MNSIVAINSMRSSHRRQPHHKGRDTLLHRGRCLWVVCQILDRLIEQAVDLLAIVEEIRGELLESLKIIFEAALSNRFIRTRRSSFQLFEIEFCLLRSFLHVRIVSRFSIE